MGSAFDTLSAALHDRYRLDRELGQGGMATVYLAHDLKHDRDVALKVVRPELAATVGPERFQQEIRLAARLQHPHILTVFDSGEAAGQLWFTMPYVDGETLRVRLDRVKQLPLEEALRVAGEVAAALTYAHARGVVHRDIKPENILFEGGEAVIADFGIARALDAAGAGLTETGLAIGTPSYMSPEQASGERIVDGRSDIYSLGSVLYEMLAGEPPFTGPTAQAIIAKRLSAPIPSVRHVRDSVPHGVDAAIQRALARAPADRFQTAAEFAAALSEGRSESLPPAQARPAGRRSAWIAAGTLVALFLAVLGWRWWRCRAGGCGIPLDPGALAILPFQVSGDSSIAGLREGLVTLLSLNLDGVGNLRTIHPRTALSRWERTVASGREQDEATLLVVGRSLGAGQVLSGTAISVGSRLRLIGELYETRSGDRHRVQVEGAPDSLQGLVDRLTVELIRQGLGGDTSGAARVSLAGMTSNSVEAVKAFLSGEQQFRRGQPAAAVEAFRRAIGADSDFALARYRLAAADGWAQSPHTPSWPSENDRVLARLSHLPPREALLIEGEWEIANGYAAGIGTLEKLTTEYPQDAEAWYLLGDAYYHLGPGNFIVGDKFPAALRRAIELDPSFAPAYVHLAEYVFDRLDSTAARGLVEDLNRIDSTSPKAVGISIAYSLAWGNPSQRRSAEAAFRAASGDALLVAKHTIDLAPDLARQTIQVAEAMVARSDLSPDTRSAAENGHGIAALITGRLAEARAAFDRSGAIAGGNITCFFDAISLIPGTPSGGGACDQHAVRATIAVQEGDRWTNDYRLGAFAAAHGWEPEVRSTMKAYRRRAAQYDSLLQTHQLPPAGQLGLQLFRNEEQGMRAYEHLVGALASLQAGDSAHAWPILQSASDTVRLFENGAASDADFLLGIHFLATGDLDQAERYFRRLSAHWWTGFRSISLITPAEFYLGRVAEARGDRDQARYHYDRFVRWWKDCDPELKPWREEGRKALARVSGEPRKD